MTAPRVFFYVQHLLGIGHLKRAATLAQALAAGGLQVTLGSGGAPVPGMRPDGVDFVQLPPASAADLSFRSLVDGDGRAVDDAWKRRRGAALLDAWRAANARVLVLELYPFGRRQMRFELLPLLEAAAARAPRPIIVCSLRDILGAPKTLERQQETLELVERYIDRVLVHGDPRVISFDRSFAAARQVAHKLEYTGYVVSPAKAGGEAGKGEVVVSVGGGAVGARLLEVALAAKPLCNLRDRTWRLLAGANLPSEAFQGLARANGVQVERARADFTTLLANCELSISQAGYNTLLETVQARARAVVVPFAGGNETEQTLRARCFAERGLVEMLEESMLTPAALAAAIDRAAGRPKPGPGVVDLDGARKSAELIAQWTVGRAA